MPPRVTACPRGERVGRGHGPWPSSAPDGSASHGERPLASCSFRLRESAPCAGPAQGRGEMQSVPRKQATSRQCPRETVGPPPCQPVLAAPCPRAHQAGCHAHAAVPQSWPGWELPAVESGLGPGCPGHFSSVKSRGVRSSPARPGLPLPLFLRRGGRGTHVPWLVQGPEGGEFSRPSGHLFYFARTGSWEVTFFPEVAGCVHLRPGNVREVWEFIRTVAAAGGGSPGGLREGRPCWESWEPLCWPRRAPTGSTSWARRLQRQRRRGMDGCGARPVSVGRGVRMPFIPLGLA